MGPMIRTTLGLALLVALLTGCGGGLPSPEPLPSGVSFDGLWDTNWGQLELRQRGGHVHGRYKGFRNGSVSGTTDGNLFVFRWTQQESRQWGRGYFQISPDGQTMKGNWGYGKTYEGGGSWWANRANR